MSEVVDNLGIPPLAGLGSYEEAASAGYPVEKTVDLLLRYQYTGRRLVDIIAAHLARTPEWELKCGLSLHVWLAAEAVAAVRARILEMRQPPPRLDVVPDAALERWLEEAIRAETTTELLVTLYRAVLPELLAQMRRHRAETNPLADYPTRRLLKRVMADFEEMVEWGQAALDAVIKLGATGDEASRWEGHLAAVLAGAPGDPLPVRWDGGPYEMDPSVARDERFADVFNATADIDQLWQDPSRPADERLLALICKRIREMDVPEWMAPIVYKTRGKPWEYYADLTRQLWDEARHAMMGEVALVQRGVPFYRYPINIASAVLLNERQTPLEAHLVLWGIEQRLMAATGKRSEYEFTVGAEDPLQSLFQDYDWADEVLHAQIGRRWLAPEFASSDEMKEAALQAFAGPWTSGRAELLARSTGREWFTDLVSAARQHSNGSK